MIQRTTVMLAPVLSLALAAMAAGAQDMALVISPGQAADGIFHRSRMEEQARRQREGAGSPAINRAVAARQKRACDSRPGLRRQYGANHPKMRKLEALCKVAGYREVGSAR